MTSNTVEVDKLDLATVVDEASKNLLHHSGEYAEVLEESLESLKESLK